MNNDEKLNCIIQKLNDINSKLNDIDNRLKIVENSTDNMDNHISFVENIYEVVKHPMSSLLSLYYGKSNHNDLCYNLENCKKIK